MSKRTRTRELYSDANEGGIFNELSLFSNMERGTTRTKLSHWASDYFNARESTICFLRMNGVMKFSLPLQLNHIPSNIKYKIAKKDN